MKTLLLPALFFVLNHNNGKNFNSINNNSGYLVRANCYVNGELVSSNITYNFKVDAFRNLCERRDNSRFEVVKLN